jgi:phosphomannomutase
MHDPIARARAWMAADPDPITAAELRALVEAGDTAEIAERMSGPLAFGTAGLRGVLGAGESRMNRAVVRRTTHGLATWLLETVARAAERGVVVGYDGRRMSREFAEETAGVLAAHGIRVFLSTTLVPTPLAAHGVLVLGAAAGVVITASHNPAVYNGYKVYAEDGGQIVPPADEQIAERIARAPDARNIDVRPLTDACIHDLPDRVRVSWYDAMAGWSLDSRGRERVSVVYTPIHGTGDVHAHAMLRRFGFTEVASVPEQAEPDGSFPTAPFPNPEEKGVLDRAIALAKQRGANLVMANDPDSDRLAVAVPLRTGAWRMLTGNEVGVLLGEHLLRHTSGTERLVVNSIVSSPQLGGIAKAHGVRFAEVLTGFKWIARVARTLEAEGARFLFGYEEALGYTVGTTVRDKDGIGALAVFAELAAVALTEGRTVEDELDRIATEHGLWVSTQVSVTKPGSAGVAQIAGIMDALRAARPERFGDWRVQGVRDLLPASNVLVFDLERDARVIARPSGTEPKIKYYVDLREEVTGDLGEARRRAEGRLAALAEAFVRVAGR